MTRTGNYRNASCTYCGQTFTQWLRHPNIQHLCRDCRFTLPKPDRTYWNTPEVRTA